MLGNSVSNIYFSRHGICTYNFFLWNMPDVVCHFDHMVMLWHSSMNQCTGFSSFKRTNEFTMVNLLNINILPISRDAYLYCVGYK